MFQIIAGTNRPQSRSMEVARIVEPLYKNHFERVNIIDLNKVPMINGGLYSENQPEELKKYVDMVNEAEGILVVCPEYNGSMPGVLKYFIDHWKYPDSFSFRPVAFIGLGGLFGGLRPVEHLQQIFGYRNAFIYPERVFLINVWNDLKDGQITNETSMNLIKDQSHGFSNYIKALRKNKLSAGTRPS